LGAVFLFSFLSVGMLCPGSSGAGKAVGPLRMAVLYFDNYSITDREILEPFRKGLADTLISSLARSKDLQVVERTRMEALLSEFDLQQTGAVTPETVQKAGKILGVEALLLGSYTAIGKMLRIDARLVDVETSRVLVAGETSGFTDDFFSMEEDLVEKILRGLKRKGLAEVREKKGGGALEALLLYSKGLDALDRGDENSARRIAGELRREYPAFPVPDERLRAPGSEDQGME